MTVEASQTLKNLLGCSLTRIEFLVHCFEGSVIGLVSCDLTFENSSFLSIRNASDGETIIIEQAREAAMELGQYGCTKLLSPAACKMEGVLVCLGRRLTEAILIVHENKPSALQLNFAGELIAIYNDADNLIVARSIANFRTRGQTRVRLA